MRKFGESHQNQRDCDTPRHAEWTHSPLKNGKTPVGAVLGLPGRGIPGGQRGLPWVLLAVPRLCRAPGLSQGSVAQGAALPWATRGALGVPVGAAGAQRLSLVSPAWFSTQICHPEVWVSVSRRMEHPPGASGSTGMPCTSHTSTSLLARVDFCLPQLDLGCETPRGGTWATSLSPLPAATALFCIGVSGQPALVSVQPVGC